MKGVRQLQHVLEVLAHRSQPPALGEPIGVEGDQDAGADAADADRPHRPSRRRIAARSPGSEALLLASASTMRPNSKGPAKAATAKPYVGQDQGDRKPPFRREQGHDTTVKAQETHLKAFNPIAHSRAFGCRTRGCSWHGDPDNAVVRRPRSSGWGQWTIG